MKIRSAKPWQRLELNRCVALLKDARLAAIGADCPQLTKKIRSAIKSGGGAQRHFSTRERATAEPSEFSTT